MALALVAAAVAGCASEAGPAGRLVWYAPADKSGGEVALRSNYTTTGTAVFFQEDQKESYVLTVFTDIPGYRVLYSFLGPERANGTAVPGHPGLASLVTLTGPVEVAVDGGTITNPLTGEEGFQGQAFAWRTQEGSGRLLVEVDAGEQAATPRFEPIVFGTVNGPVDDRQTFNNPSFQGRFVGRAIVDAAPVPGGTVLDLVVKHEDETVGAAHLEPATGSQSLDVVFPLDHAGLYTVSLAGRGVGANVRLEAKIEPPRDAGFHMEWSGVLEGPEAEAEVELLAEQEPRAVPVAVPRRVEAYAPRSFDWGIVLITALGVAVSGLFLIRLATQQISTAKANRKARK